MRGKRPTTAASISGWRCRWLAVSAEALQAVTTARDEFIALGDEEMRKQADTVVQRWSAETGQVLSIEVAHRFGSNDGSSLSVSTRPNRKASTKKEAGLSG